MAARYLLNPVLRVRVKYEPAKKQSVRLDDDTHAILGRNPQPIQKP
jgi:hypothetical protein